MSIGRPPQFVPPSDYSQDGAQRPLSWRLRLGLGLLLAVLGALAATVLASDDGSLCWWLLIPAGFVIGISVSAVGALACSNARLPVLW